VRVLGVTPADVAKAQADAKISIAACCSLVTEASHLCDGDTAIMVSALMGAIIVVASGHRNSAGKSDPVALIGIAISGLEDARGRHGEHIRRAVRAAVLGDAGGDPS
jgi:hypothetical protein